MLGFGKETFSVKYGPSSNITRLLVYSTLETLQLRGNSIGDEGCVALSQNLPRCNSCGNRA